MCSVAERDPGGRLTGRIIGRNCYGPEKLRRIRETLGRDNGHWNVIVYTDHHSDLPLLEWADSPRVVNPSSKLRRVAVERGYQILDW